MRGLIQKTVGIAEPLRAALQPVAKKIRGAFVYGSIAKGTERAGSDLDLLIVSDTLTYPEAYEALQEVEATIARTMNPTVMKMRDNETRGHTDRVVRLTMRLVARLGVPHETWEPCDAGPCFTTSAKSACPIPSFKSPDRSPTTSGPS